MSGNGNASRPRKPTPTGASLPRELAPGVFWVADCLEILFEERVVHAYHSAYLVAGEHTSLLVDTGHLKDWPEIERQLDVLTAGGAPEVRYIFPTHAEMPHSASLGRLLKKYPNAVVVGDIRDYHLIFPEYVDRFVAMGVGEEIDLGGTRFRLLDAIVRDLVSSIWGYDTRSRTLFPGDGFAYMHHHAAGECGKLAEQIPDLEVAEFTAAFAENALYWSRFTDLEPHIRRLEELLDGEYPVDVIAPGHGCPILDPAQTVPKVKQGLRLAAASGLQGGY